MEDTLTSEYAYTLASAFVARAAACPSAASTVTTSPTAAATTNIAH